MIRPARITWAAALLLFASGIALALGIFAFFVPDADRAVSIVVTVGGVWGLVTGTGLLRLWRWARMSAVITGGLSTFVGLTLIPMIPFLQIPVPNDLQGQLRMKVVLIIVFLFFAVIGFWWAYLLSSSTIKELFGSSAMAHARPFTFTVVGWFFLINAILTGWSVYRGVRHGPLIMM